MTHSKAKIKENEDAITTCWMKAEQWESFADFAFYTADIPAKEQ